MVGDMKPKAGCTALHNQLKVLLQCGHSLNIQGCHKQLLHRLAFACLAKGGSKFQMCPVILQQGTALNNPTCQAGRNPHFKCAHTCTYMYI